MKYLVPSLLILAGAPVFGASIADDLVIKPKVQIQMRGQFAASGTNAAGADTSIYNGATGDTEAARFSVRRARFGAEATNSTGWTGVFQIRAGERADATGNAGSATRTAELYYANAAKVFKVEGADIDVHGGLDKPFNRESSISSSTFLLPMDNPILARIEMRSVGVGAKALIQDLVRVGFDIQNGNSTVAQDTDSGAPGLFYSGRIEFAPSKEMMPAKGMESWAGAPGTHLVVGLDAQSQNKQITAVGPGTTVTAGIRNDDKTVTTTTVGPDVLFHFDGLSALAAYRMRTAKQENSASTAPDDIKGSMFSIQAGYAVPLDNGLVLEPALRFSKIDNDKDVDGDANAVFGSGEYTGSNSGTEFSIGVNAYWNGHKNKTMLAFTSFTGESPAIGDAAKAKVITLQHQLTF